MQPRAAAKLMRKNFNAVMKYHNKLWTMITLERLTSRGIGTNEVVKFAAEQTKISKKHHDFENIVNENMNRKLFHAQQNVKRAKHDMIQNRIEMKKVVRQNTLGYDEFRH